MQANDQCDTRQDIKKCDVLWIGDYMIQNPSLVPCCAAALIFGIWTHKMVVAKKQKSYYFYSVAFLMTGFMMVLAALCDCLLVQFEKKIQYIYYMIFLFDVGLTGCIAICYFFCGLNDVGVIQDRAKCPKILFLLICVVYIYAWYYCTMHYKIELLFFYLYDVVVVFCCGGYLLM